MNESLKPESPRSPASPGEQGRRAEPSHAVEAEEPLKQHGDALLDGSGNRHGVREPKQRPSS